MPAAQSPEHRLPDLRIVAVDLLVPHEHHDAQRSAPLQQRMREQGILRNPPIVAPIHGDDAGRFVVLDGANRVTAIRDAGLPHALVQVVSYDDPGLLLSTWHHALVAFPTEQLESAFASLSGLTREPADLRHASAVLARREAIAYVAHGTGQAFTLHGGGDLHQRNALLNSVVDAYRDRARFYRVTSDSLPDIQARRPEVTELVVFPRFAPSEVVELATSGARLPAGITRHLIPNRALRVNVPLDRLADNERSVADKNRWLEDWLRDKVNQRQVRFYEESTVLFDE
jgi:hypothetical protein